MSHSPYTPPDSDITPREPELPPRPQVVTWAVWMVFLDAILGLLYFVPGIATPEEFSEVSLAIAMTIIILFLLAFMIWCGLGILKGRSVARWSILVLVALSMLLGITMPTEGNYSVVRRVMDGFGMLLEAGILVMLILPASRQWFRDCAAIR